MANKDIVEDDKKLLQFIFNDVCEKANLDPDKMTDEQWIDAWTLWRKTVNDFAATLPAEQKTHVWDVLKHYFKLDVGTALYKQKSLLKRFEDELGKMSQSRYAKMYNLFNKAGLSDDIIQKFITSNDTEKGEGGFGDPRKIFTPEQIDQFAKLLKKERSYGGPDDLFKNAGEKFIMTVILGAPVSLELAGELLNMNKKNVRQAEHKAFLKLKAAGLMTQYGIKLNPDDPDIKKLAVLSQVKGFDEISDTDLKQLRKDFTGRGPDKKEKLPQFKTEQGLMTVGDYLEFMNQKGENEIKQLAQQAKKEGIKLKFISTEKTGDDALDDYYALVNQGDQDGNDSPTVDRYGAVADYDTDTDDDW